MKDITTKFADFKKKQNSKFDKNKEFNTLSSDIIALGKLDDGEYEIINEPVEIISIIDMIKDPAEISKLEENFTTDTTLNVGEVKRGQTIWLSAMLKKSNSSSWNSQVLGCIKCRVIDFYYGLNKLNSVKKII
jgi:hypothetical protein